MLKRTKISLADLAHTYSTPKASLTVPLNIAYIKSALIENHKNLDVNLFKNPEDFIKNVNLTNRRNNFPNQVSGGEQQRAAIARALINKPSLIIADEPTGNLDSKTAISVVSLFNELVDEYGCSLFLATHNLEIANLQDRLINIEDLIK